MIPNTDAANFQDTMAKKRRTETHSLGTPQAVDSALNIVGRAVWLWMDVENCFTLNGFVS